MTEINYKLGSGFPLLIIFCIRIGLRIIFSFSITYLNLGKKIKHALAVTPKYYCLCRLFSFIEINMFN